MKRINATYAKHFGLIMTLIVIASMVGRVNRFGTTS